MGHVDYYSCDRCQRHFMDEDYGALIELRRYTDDSRKDLCKHCSYELKTWLDSNSSKQGS